MELSLVSALPRLGLRQWERPAQRGSSTPRPLVEAVRAFSLCLRKGALLAGGAHLEAHGARAGDDLDQLDRHLIAELVGLARAIADERVSLLPRN